MRKYLVFFVLIYLISFGAVHAAPITTTGFIPGQIWYSKDTITEGDTVKIYTAIWNDSTSPLTAKVEFYDKNVILGTRDVVISSLQLKEVSVSWKVTAGDHEILAKIISPSITSGGKKEIVVVGNNLTASDRKFVPVVLKTIEGKPASSTDVLKSQIDKVTSSLDGIVPSSISDPVSKNGGAIDGLREDIYKNVLDTKVATEKKIETINKQNNFPVSDAKIASDKVVVEKGKSIEQSTEKPIAYIKLFLFTILSFIFGNKLIFYFVLFVIIFFIIRGIYRKIKK